MPFDLTANPFFLLGATVRARRDEIVDAFEAAVARGADEAGLSRAQQTVLTPRSRLEAEVRWLLGTAPRYARQIVEGLERGEVADALSVVDSLRGLDRANLAAHMCVKSGDARFLLALLQGYEQFTLERVAAELAAVRAVAGFPVPDDKLLRDSLVNLRSDHAKAGLTVVCRAPQPGTCMTSVVEAFLARPSENMRLLLNALVREYDLWSVPVLGEVRDRIERAIAADRLAPSSAGPDEVAGLLSEWDLVSQPVQLVELSKGHEESRSKQIYKTVREFELALANDESRYRDALVIARALSDAFSELPAAAEQLAEDIEKLEELAEAAELEESVGPLHTALEAAQADLPTFVAEVVGGGFRPGGAGLAGMLFDAFSQAVTELAATGNRDIPWTVVRGFAVDLHNEHEQADAAGALIRGLMSFDGAPPTHEMVETLRRDEAAVTRTTTWATILRLEPSDPRTPELVESLLATAQGEERSALLGIQTRIREQKARAAKTRLWWTSAAVCLVALWVYAGTTEEPEVLPPLGGQEILSRAETRWCVFQRARLEALHSMVSQRQDQRGVQTYNRKLEDYRARCNDARFFAANLTAAHDEVASRKSEFMEDARRMLGDR